MGCSSGRPEMSPVEARFYLGEMQLKYQRHSGAEIEQVHRKHSNEGTINESQWAEISKSLDLAFSNKTSDFSEKIQQFYSSFKSGETYKLQDLLALGVMLSNSSTEVKAALIFSAFSESGSEISRSAVGKVHDVLFKNSVKRCLKITKDESKARPSPEEWKVYLERLKNGRDYFREHFVFSIAADGESVSKEGFVSYFADPKNSSLLTTTGFRKTLVGFDPTTHHHKSHDALTSHHS